MSNEKESIRSIKHSASLFIAAVVGLAGVFGVAYLGLPAYFGVSYDGSASTTVGYFPPQHPPLDVSDYNARLLALAHVGTTTLWYQAFMQGTTSIVLPGATTTTYVKPRLWPVMTALPEDSRAILPFHRIVAYYGNFYSKGMGILGEYDETTVLARLKEAAAEWEAADPNTPVLPAIEYIDVTAQGSAGKDGKYRARMPDSQIDKALDMAHQVNGIVILDIQVGLSTLQDELPLLKDYLAKSDVHLAIDPEFSMKDGVPPGDEIGTFNANDINYTINFLSDLVKQNDLPPKVLIVHRFTEEMVTGYKNIKPTPQVQVVMNMDGWGFPAKKINTYNAVVNPEPVQFTGLKLFYKNDLKQTPARLLTTDEVLNLTPSPIYIQYQ